MIVICPYCGAILPSTLNDGIILCPHCGRVVESSDKNELLAAARYVKKFCCYDLERVQTELNLSGSISESLNKYVIEGDYSFDQIVKVIGNEPSCACSDSRPR